MNNLYEKEIVLLEGGALEITHSGTTLAAAMGVSEKLVEKIKGDIWSSLLEGVTTASEIVVLLLSNAELPLNAKFWGLTIITDYTSRCVEKLKMIVEKYAKKLMSREISPDEVPKKFRKFLGID